MSSPWPLPTPPTPVTGVPAPTVEPEPYGSETTLYEYMLDTQRLIADTSQTYVNPEDLTAYINKARREVAMRTQSIRILPPVQGRITHIDVVRGGSGYTDPVVHISWPDAPSGSQPHPRGKRAEAIAHVGPVGEILSIEVLEGGSGYFRPVVRISERWEWEDDWFDRWGFWPWTEDERDDEEDRRWNYGHGARAFAHTQPILKTEGFQEIYPFRDVPLDRFPGVKSIFAVKGISFIYMNYRYSIPCFSFTDYQAYVRIYPQQYLYVPTACAQYGQGVNGSLYMYPIPSTMYQMEWDTFCVPKDMETDEDFEAIPQPWCDCVSLFAAHRCYLGMQNHNASQYYLSLYDDMCRRYSAYARPGRKINPYGRWAAFT